LVGATSQSLFTYQSLFSSCVKHCCTIRLDFSKGFSIIFLGLELIDRHLPRAGTFERALLRNSMISVDGDYEKKLYIYIYICFIHLYHIFMIILLFISYILVILLYYTGDNSTFSMYNTNFIEMKFLKIYVFKNFIISRKNMSFCLEFCTSIFNIPGSVFVSLALSLLCLSSKVSFALDSSSVD